MKTINDSKIDFDSYFAEHQIDAAKVRPAGDWVEEVIDSFYGQTSAANWAPIGFDKMRGKFDLRAGEVTLWTGVNGHGKTSFLSDVMIRVMSAGQKVCLASLEMKPSVSMKKMTMQAAGIGEPSIGFIRGFHGWTNGKLWIYDHVGKLAASRALAVATYVRNELKIDHLVIDSLMKCGMGTDDYTAQKDFVDSLCSIARDTGLHIHLVCHMRKGENESKPAEKFDVKGASEIVDLCDNLMIIWKNLPKAKDLADAEREPNAIQRRHLIGQINQKPDAFVRLAKQRNHPWEGSFAFWFDKESQQFLEHSNTRTMAAMTFEQTAEETFGQ